MLNQQISKWKRKISTQPLIILLELHQNGPSQLELLRQNCTDWMFKTNRKLFS